MRLQTVDFRLLIGLILAHLLLFFSFQDRSIFWYILTGSMLLLIIYAMFQKSMDDKISLVTYLLLGFISGLLLYGLFWIGHEVFSLFHLPVQQNINKLYRWYAPNALWKFLCLVVVIIPGEEFFWRGFVQKRLLHYFTPKVSITIDAVLYASVQIYSHQVILIAAFLITGFVWGTLYYWKKNLSLVIISHLVFNILLLLILPLK